MKHDSWYVEFVGDWQGKPEEEIGDDTYRWRGEVGEELAKGVQEKRCGPEEGRVERRRRKSVGGFDAGRKGQ